MPRLVKSFVYGLPCKNKKLVEFPECRNSIQLKDILCKYICAFRHPVHPVSQSVPDFVYDAQLLTPNKKAVLMTAWWSLVCYLLFHPTWAIDAHTLEQYFPCLNLDVMKAFPQVAQMTCTLSSPVFRLYFALHALEQNR